MEAAAPSRRRIRVLAIGACLSALTALAGAAVGPTTLLAKGGTVRLPVRHCRTELPYPGPAPHHRHAGPTRFPASLGAAQLAVFEDAIGGRVVGPRGWRCRAAEGADGTEFITVARTAIRDITSQHPREAVSLLKIPGCAGCMAEQLCSIFPKAPPVKPYASVLECPWHSPEERVRVVGRWTATFEDPPGAEGQGIPSGGPNPAIGRLAYMRRRGFAQVTCTLQARRAQTCRRIAALGIRAWKR